MYLNEKLMYQIMNNTIDYDLVKTLNMIGPIQLTDEKIDQFICGRSPGNYALGIVKGHAFIVKYIGRSDVDINGALKSWIGHYSYFKWSYASSEKSAYDKECQNFHDFGETDALDNTQHPEKSEGVDWSCLICGQ